MPILVKYFTRLCVFALVLAWIEPLQADNMKGLRGQRYCEVFLAVQKSGFPQIRIYNTIGLNQCPPTLWNQLTPKELRKTTHSLSVILNGPRFWIIDGLRDSTLINPKIEVFGGIAMREAGILKVRWIDFLRTRKPYQSHTVNRQTTWIYQSGKPVYELIDSQHKVYIMQSYSAEKENQNEASLATLGSKLKLPPGWKFRTRVLKRDAYLTPVNHQATIVQDDFLNTYQQETPSFNSYF